MTNFTYANSDFTSIQLNATDFGNGLDCVLGGGINVGWVSGLHRYLVTNDAAKIGNYSITERTCLL